MMQSHTKIATTAVNHAESHRTADRVYQVLTIAAMLVLLVSLWAF